MRTRMRISLLREIRSELSMESTLHKEIRSSRTIVIMMKPDFMIREHIDVVSLLTLSTFKFRYGVLQGGGS